MASLHRVAPVSGPPFLVVASPPLAVTVRARVDRNEPVGVGPAIVAIVSQPGAPMLYTLVLLECRWFRDEGIP